MRFKFQQVIHHPNPLDQTTSHSTKHDKAVQVHPQGVRRGCKGLKPQQNTQAGYPRGRESLFGVSLEKYRFLFIRLVSKGTSKHELEL